MNAKLNKEEVDFLIAERNKPLLLIEAKHSDDTPAKALKKFQPLFKVPAVQLVNREGVCKLVSNDEHKVLIISAPQWLSRLP